MKVLLPLVLSLALLAGCGGAPLNPEVQRQFYIWQSCVAYHKALDTLSLLREAGQLSQAEIGSVQAVVDVVGPWCEAPEAPEVDAGYIDAQLDAVLERIIISRSLKK